MNHVILAGELGCSPHQAAKKAGRAAVRKLVSQPWSHGPSVNCNVPIVANDDEALLRDQPFTAVAPNATIGC